VDEVCTGAYDGAVPRGAGIRGEVAMSLTDVLPEVQTLSRLDKIRLIQFLARDLARDEENLIEPGRSYPVWSPDRAFAAAAVLQQILEDEKDKS
jgi:ligand-binding sensor protein